MTAVEILAVILAVMVLVKLIIIFINPRSWAGVSETMLKNTHLVSAIYLVLAVVVGYFVFSEMSILQVGAATLFVTLLMGLALTPHAKLLLKIRKTLYKSRRKILAMYWLPSLIWVIIAIWILVVAFK